MKSSKNKVRVNIYGEEYTVLSDGEVEYIRDVAAFVDRKMRQMADRTSNKSPSRIAILAALNMADELFHERQKGETELTSVRKRTNDIISLLDERLAETIE
jgi:cell division protein ZapA